MLAVLLELSSRLSGARSVSRGGYGVGRKWSCAQLAHFRHLLLVGLFDADQYILLHRTSLHYILEKHKYIMSYLSIVIVSKKYKISRIWQCKNPANRERITHALRDLAASWLA